MSEQSSIKCVECGQFVSYESMTDGSASFYFEPDNHFGRERSEWTCAKCVNKAAHRVEPFPFHSA